jgi:hypothetical protein
VGTVRATSARAAHAVFTDLEHLGISYDHVVQATEDEGVAKFEASWNELLNTLKKNMRLKCVPNSVLKPGTKQRQRHRSRAPASPTLRLEPCAAGSAAATTWPPRICALPALTTLTHAPLRALKSRTGELAGSRSESPKEKGR